MMKKSRAYFMREFKQKAVGQVQYGESVAAASKTLSVLGLTLLNWAKTHLARATRRCVEQSGDC